MNADIHKDPFCLLPIASIKLLGFNCEVCKLPVPNMNSLSAYESYYDKFDLVAHRDKHVLPVIIDGKVLCGGSPSRAQKLYGQPPDIRPELAASLSQVSARDSRDAYDTALYMDAGAHSVKPLRTIANKILCPDCRHASDCLVLGSVREGWVVQFHCNLCDREDTIMPVVLIPYERRPEIIHIDHIVSGRFDDRTLGILGINAMRISCKEARGLRNAFPAE